MNNNWNSRTIDAPAADVSLYRTFLSNVFVWMFLALAISAVTAYLFSTSPNLINSLFSPETGNLNLMGWAVIFLPFAFVLFMSIGFQKLSASTLALVFVGYSIAMGLSLSFILLSYTAASIFKTFIIAAGMFGAMAVIGYTTKTDLSRFGSIMYMGLIGIILASVVNFFMRSQTLDYIVSIIGVLVFTGLTAYDIQKLKRIGGGLTYGAESTRKLTIMGALTLYLDFINLFLFLLRLFGDRRS